MNLKWAEYLRHKKLIVERYKAKMEALKTMYPEEWARDHKRKAAGK